MSAAQQPSSPRSPTVSVVVGFAFTDADGPAFERAAKIATWGVGGELHLVHVFDANAPRSEERALELAGRLRTYVEEKAASMGGLAGLHVGVHLRYGDTVREILQLATDVGATMIVVGSQSGPHLKQWIMGSTADKLLAHGSIPVLVASPRAASAPVEEVPAIEPPCPDCTRVRLESRGNDWWCERHAKHAKSGHTYSYQREWPFSGHDSAVSPTGIDF